MVAANALFIVAGVAALLLAMGSWQARRETPHARWRWLAAVALSGAVAWADWSVDWWAHCADCQLRVEIAWFGLPAQLPALGLLLLWASLGMAQPLVRALGAGAAGGAALASAVTLLSLGWWCVACVTLQITLLLAVLLCPVSWRRYVGYGLGAGVLAGFLVGLGYRDVEADLDSQTDSYALPPEAISLIGSEASLSEGGQSQLQGQAQQLRQQLNTALTLGVDAQAPLIVLDFDWTCARCITLVPQLLAHAQDNLAAGTVRLRLRPHCGRSEISQELYQIGLGAAQLGELDQFMQRLFSASIKVRDDVFIALGPRLGAWQAAAAELPAHALNEFSELEQRQAQAMIGRRMLPVLNTRTSAGKWVRPLSLHTEAIWHEVQEVVAAEHSKKSTQIEPKKPAQADRIHPAL